MPLWPSGGSTRYLVSDGRPDDKGFRVLEVLGPLLFGKADHHPFDVFHGTHLTKEHEMMTVRDLRISNISGI